MEGDTTLTRCSDLDFKQRIRSNLDKTHVSRVCVKSEEMHARTITEILAPEKMKMRRREAGAVISQSYV